MSPSLELYLNIHLTGAPGSSLLTEIAEFHFRGLRVGVAEDHSIATAQTRALYDFPKLKTNFLLAGGEMTRFDGEPWQPKALVQHTWDQCKKLEALGWFDREPELHPALEIGNEPDIAHQFWKKNPKLLGETFTECYDVIREFSAYSPVLTPSISNLLSTKNRGIDYLEKLASSGLPSGCVVSFHRYPAGRFFSIPHQGFKTRVHEIDALRSIAGSRPIWNTETGWSEENGDYKLDEAEISDRLSQEIGFHLQNDVKVLTIYQLNSATIMPGDSKDVRRLKSYGLRAPTDDGWHWKPSASAVKLTAEKLKLV